MCKATRFHNYSDDITASLRDYRLFWLIVSIYNNPIVKKLLSANIQWTLHILFCVGHQIVRIWDIIKSSVPANSIIVFRVTEWRVYSVIIRYNIFALGESVEDPPHYSNLLQTTHPEDTSFPRLVDVLKSASKSRRSVCKDKLAKQTVAGNFDVKELETVTLSPTTPHQPKTIHKCYDV